MRLGDRLSDVVVQELIEFERKHEAEGAPLAAFETVEHEGGQSVGAYLSDALNYELELNLLPDAELLRLVETSVLKSKLKHAIKRDEREKWQPYNLRFARPAHKHWAEYPSWSTEEAVALSLDRSPDVLNLAAITSGAISIDSPLAFDFRKRLELVSRALVVGELRSPLLPPDFIHWAERRSLSFPDAIRDALPAAAESADGEQATALEAEVVRLQSLVAKQSERLSYLEIQEGTTSARSLFKIVLSMAIKHYGYLPGRNNSAAKIIASDSELDATLRVTDDTVRRWLAIAQEMCGYSPLPDDVVRRKPKSD